MDSEKTLIAACPRCSARYRVNSAALPPQGGRLRCAKCAAVFRVTQPARTPLPTQARALTSSGRAPGSERPTDGPVVVIGDSDPDSGKAIAQVLVDWGCEPVLVHDGVEAILAIQRVMPAAVVIDSDLPKMSGLQICELMKRNESLRHLPLVLVGVLHRQDRTRGTPEADFGADAYVERPQLPEALRPILRGLGVALGERPAAPTPDLPEVSTSGVVVPPVTPEISPEPVGAERPEPSSVPEVFSPPPEADDPALAEAERLARIIVSDIVLYNAEKFESGVRSGEVLNLLAGELDEGRALFAQRVDAAVREGRDFLSDELLRVAKSRGMGA